MGGPGGPGPTGGLLGAAEPSKKLVALLRQGSGSLTWVAATVGAENAAGYQLAGGAPVMATGVSTAATRPRPSRRSSGGWRKAGSTTSSPAPGPYRTAGPTVREPSRNGVAATFHQVSVDGVVVFDLSDPL
jgi:hypothetical protein